MHRLFLWDIDGTILLAKGSGKRAMNRSFWELFHIPDAFDNIQMTGGLDMNFVQAAFANHQIPLDQIAPFFEAYYGNLQQELNNMTVTLMPGVIELLDKIEQTDFCFNSIATGNMERSARMKLEVFNLNRYFPVGGFCRSAGERYEVLLDGIRNAENYYQTNFTTGQVTVIGDTVEDIRAARKINASVIAVATGPTSYEQLASEKPDLLLLNLQDYNHIKMN
ncbi:HAD hydrolase-like protein [Effusibacillus dendaii]|uniref:HAD family hydrolase n=1 Tax=Effusibacillus dendaii TaxID=2743772 RepID=A0A7I8DE63_9BACL|nr:HAD hydrolase-like protein [Effusibacillus dendaii]BCJ87126.1 hypothetical protein skT53_21110 [Effusibacillus dendaii]